MGSTETRGPNIGEKPTTLGSTEARGPNVGEKPTTLGSTEARGPDIGEKPTTLGSTETRGPNIGEKPTTLGRRQGASLRRQGLYFVSRLNSGVDGTTRGKAIAFAFVSGFLPIREINKIWRQQRL
ncbi:hypothetical protein [Paenibacillus sp. FSL M7-0896]|uniref:hypothetical protein n=1 Tax=Paenibacillus sp. FSL M7-0896 TaxID=2921610 RepID=UPI0030DB9783